MSILEKKMESYLYDNKNFIAESELMVTITLDEYRDLVAMNARIFYENQRLKEELETLKAKIKPIENLSFIPV